jgi:hypothetical protein
MRAQLSRIILYVSLLGSAIASVVSGQQVSLTLLVVLLAFALSFILLDISKLSRGVYAPYFWFVLATVPGTVLYLLRGSSPMVPMQQYIGILIFWIVVWNIFRYQKYSVEKIFYLYLRCAKLAACIGIAQQIAYLLDIKVLYDLRWILIGVGDIDVSGPFLRVYSLFTEPSYFAVFLIPALYLSILKIIGASRLVDFSSSIIFIVAIFCTFSTIGYIGFLLCIIFAFRLSLRNILLSIAIAIILLSLVSTSPVISSRLLSISNVIEGGLKGDENLSVFTNALNLNITKNILSDYPIFGLGIGSYRIYSIPYLEDLIAGDYNIVARVSDQFELFTLTDGGTMYLRLSAELGIVGCLIFTLLMLRRRRKKVSKQHSQIAKAALLFVIVFSIRSGQLVRFDFIFFCALYSLVCIQTVRLERGDFRQNFHKWKCND